MQLKWHNYHKTIVMLKANDTQSSQSEDFTTFSTTVSKWWQEIASTVCRKRTTVSLISAIGTVIFTITPTCQRHTRTIQTSKVRRRTRCNQTSYTKMLQTCIHTHTLTYTKHIYTANTWLFNAKFKPLFYCGYKVHVVVIHHTLKK